MTSNPEQARQESSVSAIVRLAVQQVAKPLGCQIDDSVLALDDSAAQSSLNTQVHGAFVTLRRKGRLRACYGNFDASGRASQAVAAAAIAVTQRDYRFPAFSRRELPFLELDVSLLVNYQAVNGPARNRADLIQIGRHGIVIRRDQKSALLLPQVAPEWNWNAIQFLEQVCRKAGLECNEWMNQESELYTFEALVEETRVDRFLTATQRDSLLSPRSLPIRDIALHVGHLITSGNADQTSQQPWSSIPIQGAICRVRNQLKRQGIRFGRLDLFDSFTLSDCVDWCVTKARQWEAHWKDDSVSENGIDVDLTVLHSPATHAIPQRLRTRLGDERPLEQSDSELERLGLDLDGYDKSHNSMIWSVDSSGDKGEFCCSFEPYLDWQVQSESIRDSGMGTNSAKGHWLSMEVSSTRRWERWDGSSCQRIDWPNTSLDRQLDLNENRPPAVAGVFYPADFRQLTQEVEQYFDSPTPPALKASAIQVPHAGLAYSGRIAAQVMSSVEIPESVIILSPKHRREGENWSICPCTRWDTVGHSFETDRELFFSLLEHVDGLLPDAAAHRKEHGIEVQLPLLAHVAPHAKIVGITIGQASLFECLQFAEGLATAIKHTASQPLIVISSDMNHFATDAENRRLDEIALRAIETLDCRHIYQSIVEKHGITMCGVRPNVITLAALQTLGTVDHCERIGYATSADISGDASRVVGYAGLRFLA